MGHNLGEEYDMAKKNAKEKLMQELLAPEYRLKCEYAIHIIELKLEMLMELLHGL